MSNSISISGTTYKVNGTVKKDNKGVLDLHVEVYDKDIFEEKNIFNDEISKSFRVIEDKGSGAIVLINSDMSPRINKIFNRRDEETNKLELREYGVGAQILSAIGIKKIILLTNTKKKIIALNGFNLQIVRQEII